MNSEDKAFVTELLDDKNYLGTAQFIKELDLPGARRSAYMGQVVSAVIEDLGAARSKSDRERVVYLRSVLAWLLKDYPGLASIYREQLRLASGGRDVLPELARGFRNVGDVFSGKKSVQEGVEDAAEPLENFADQAGDFIRDGLNQVGRFFENLNKEAGASEEKVKEESDMSDDDLADEGSPVDIKIEDADDPLPHDIHNADNSDKTGAGSSDPNTGGKGK